MWVAFGPHESRKALSLWIFLHYILTHVNTPEKYSVTAIDVPAHIELSSVLEQSKKYSDMTRRRNPICHRSFVVFLCVYEGSGAKKLCIRRG